MYPKYQVLYYNRDPEREHDFDNHPYLKCKDSRFCGSKKFKALGLAFRVSSIHWGAKQFKALGLGFRVYIGEQNKRFRVQGLKC